MPYGFVNGSVCKIKTFYNLHVSKVESYPFIFWSWLCTTYEVDYRNEPQIKMLHEKIKKTIKGTKRSLNNNDTISVEVDHANGEQQGMPVEGVARVLSSPRKTSSRKQKQKGQKDMQMKTMLLSVLWTS